MSNLKNIIFNSKSVIEKVRDGKQLSISDRKAIIDFYTEVVYNQQQVLKVTAEKDTNLILLLKEIVDILSFCDRGNSYKTIINRIKDSIESLDEEEKTFEEKRNYYIEQIDKALKYHNANYYLKIKISGTHDSSNYMSLPADLLITIKNYYYEHGHKI